MAKDKWICSRWEDALFARVAYVARYGNTSPEESMDWDMRFMRRFHRALSDIVAEENKTPT
jgi:hypothetical protein